MLIINRKRASGYILFFVTLGTLLGLGTWQVYRGLDKSAISRMAHSSAPDVYPLNQAPSQWQDLNYRQVALSGRWLRQKSFLLDNRFYQGRSGVEVLDPFELAGDSTVILVNRGWVENHTGGTHLITGTATGAGADVLISGQLYLPQKGFTLGPTISGSIKWPLRFLYYEFNALSDALGVTLSPVVVVLNQDNPDSFEQIWQPANMPPERHFAYAVQWWGLALTLIIFGLIWRRKPRI
jgi:surfeit locus 1 family protein